MSTQDDAPEMAPVPSLGATQTTIDQMEKLFAEPEKPPQGAPPQQQPAPDDVPDAYKGKGVRELIAQNEALQRAMMISEQGRVAAMRMAQQTPQAPQEQAPKEFTREEIAEMMASDDPNVRVQAVDIMNTQAIRRAEAQVNARFQQLQDSTVAAAELEARRLYPKEFELFGEQIYGIAQQFPNRAALGNVGQWRELIAYVRGRDENIFRFAQSFSQQAPNGNNGAYNSTMAREIESQSTGFTAAPIRQPANSASNIKVDPFTAEIARTFGRDPVEYAREIAAIDK